ncbi:hypothetical protein HMPREF1544_10629 [Mucor circinelloides 1006PhL]|uniref:Uncharacterized protein n=1 Tax=Mucor circinelloides f. circinelloides (strain 1006PhL) TaxID=1220926 RepID=S2IZC4_MUCC1|nr:hypothetical protein HMPREF1544_10629 [Mucor circinelloides 1006PhL]
MATSNRYEFQPPMNMSAIRSNIMQRIKQRNEHNKQPLTPPPSSSSIASKHEVQYVHLDNGLPSPPIESCTFDEDVDTFEMANNHSSTLPDSPPSPVMSLSKSSSSSTTESTVAETTFESSEAIREKIRILKEEKHRLFQTMKDLLSQPAQPVAPEAVAAVAAAAPIIEKPAPKQQQPAVSKPMVERSRSQSRDNSLKSRPIIRSRSISHTEFSRPLSRYTGGNYYHERRSPPRFYGNDNRGYPYNRSSYPHTSSLQSQSQNTSLSSSSSSPSLNMSRRVLNSNNINNNINNNNNNNNSSYVSSRSQLAGRPSSSSAVSAAAVSGIASASASTSTTFRPLNRSSSDRHSRY